MYGEEWAVRILLECFLVHTLSLRLFQTSKHQVFLTFPFDGKDQRKTQTQMLRKCEQGFTYQEAKIFRRWVEVLRLCL